MTSHSETKLKWWRWHNANPDVYDMFGHTHLSAWLIVNRIRWEVAMETSGDDFKISNDFIAYYARLFHAKNKKHEGFFRTKKLKEEQ